MPCMKGKGGDKGKFECKKCGATSDDKDKLCKPRKNK